MVVFLGLCCGGLFVLLALQVEFVVGGVGEGGVGRFVGVGGVGGDCTKFSTFYNVTCIIWSITLFILYYW